MVVFVESVSGIVAEDLQGFFQHWARQPSSQTLLAIFQNSSHVVLAREDDGGVIGDITAISDGISCAYIPHLEVLEAFRGQGIGSELVRRMLGRLSELYMVDLICDPDLQPFYARFGFQPCGGMIRRNYARQACE